MTAYARCYGNPDCQASQGFCQTLMPRVVVATQYSQGKKKDLRDP